MTDQVYAVPPSVQAAASGGRSRYKTCQGTVFEAGLHRLARLPVDPLRTVGPERPRRLPTMLSDRPCDLPARRIQPAPVPQSVDQDDTWTPANTDRHITLNLGSKEQTHSKSDRVGKSETKSEQ